MWHFAAKDMVKRVASSGTLGRIATAMHRHGEHRIGGITVALATPRAAASDAHDAPLAMWWASDARLLATDTGHRPLIDALVVTLVSAPIWLTAFGVELDAPVGRRDDSDLIAPDPAVAPIVVVDSLQDMVTRHSGMNLVNGVHDSCAPPLEADLRRRLRSGDTTPEAVAVAALRAGWWPDRVPHLLEKLAVPRR